MNLGECSQDFKRMVPCESTADRISNLPSSMVENILIRLPIRDAARMSILSKNWRFKWLYLPQLVFDVVYSPTKSRNQLWLEIFRILLLHRGPLDKFVISFNHVSKTDISLIDQIMSLLNGKDIHELTLSSPFNNYIMTSTLFQCVQLTHLTVSGWVFKLLPDFMGFKRLTDVELTKICLNACDFQTIISKSPLLQRIKLEFILEDDVSLEIDAPNLKYLDFCCNSTSRSSILKNVPLLSTLIIKFRSRFPAPASNLVQLFGSLPVIESFCASHSCFLVDFYGGDIPERLPTMLNKLKSVELSEMRFNSLKEIQCVLLLLRSSPNLKKLKIQAYSRVFYAIRGDDTPISELFKVLWLEEDSFNQLGEVEIDFFGGTKPELEFVKVILSKSPVLKNIMLIRHGEFDREKMSEEVKLVTQFQRASPVAEIIFSDSALFVDEHFQTHLPLCFYP